MSGWFFFAVILSILISIFGNSSGTSVVTLRNCRQRFRFLRVMESSELSEKQDIIDLSNFLESSSLGRLSSISTKCLIINIMCI